MTEFTQDKIFKNTIETDAAILFDEFGVSTEMIRFWTKELRLLDPKDYRPDIILELNDRNLIVELQSTKVDDEFSARGLTYVSVANRVKKNSKQMDLMVISSAESSKIIYYQYNNKNVFVYEVKGLQDMDAEQIINIGC